VPEPYYPIGLVAQVFGLLLLSLSSMREQRSRSRFHGRPDDVTSRHARVWTACAGHPAPLIPLSANAGGALKALGGDCQWNQVLVCRSAKRRKAFTTTSGRSFGPAMVH